MSGLRKKQKRLRPSSRAKTKPGHEPSHAKTKPEHPVIRCVIFDLDDTLYDCFRQRVRGCHRHAAEAMVAAGLQAKVETVYQARMRAFRTDPMLRHIDAEVCRQFQASDPVRISRAAREAYFNFPVVKMTLFPGTMPLLRGLRERGVRVFVVSFGEPKTQQAKVRALGLESSPLIERILYADRDKVLTKEDAFRQIQSKVGVPASEILVVGDRPMSEIRAGKELGMRTVRIRGGEFVSQEPQSKAEEADFVVRRIGEVASLPFDWGP